jgi:polyhydroxyalkanoate synthase
MSAEAWPPRPLRARDLYGNDPVPTTPFELVDESELLRLRHYGQPRHRTSPPPVLLVSSLIKRPYVLDLVPERSVVRSLSSAGLSVYLTDWSPPPEHADWGLDAYVDDALGRAVRTIKTREGGDTVTLVGACFGGLLAVLYSALYPRDVAGLVPVATPLTMRPPCSTATIEALVRLHGHVPAWWLRAGLNARVPAPPFLSYFLAQELNEPALAAAPSALEAALRPWIDSDVPLAGRVFREIVGDAYAGQQLEQSRLRVADRRVVLERIRCPVLCVTGLHDQLVPPHSAAPLVAKVGSAAAANLVFPTGHLGLLLGAEAHRTLWPRIAEWLSGVAEGTKHEYDRCA